MKEESQFLKRRAGEFWQRAKEDFQKERYNLAVLDIEQAIQLWVKYLIFLKAGDFPKTHYFNILVESLAKIYNSPLIKDFYQDNILQFKSLEDAYLTSRYLPREFTREEAKRFTEFASRFLKILEETVNEKLI